VHLWGVGRALGIDRASVGKITRQPVSTSAREDYVPFGDAAALRLFGGDWDGYVAVICTDAVGSLVPAPPRAIYAVPNLQHLRDGDVVTTRPDGGVRVWYRRASLHNAILLTEQCNSFCLMCSQPPKLRDDSDRVALILRLIELIDPATGGLVLSGGEPTLLGDEFLRIIQRMHDRLPGTGVHVLTNGRKFSDAPFAHRLARIEHNDLVLGIPLYSDIDWRHDYVVQARGAYDETIAGLYNLAAARVRLEVRVVLHQQTIHRLPQLAGFIARNLPFVEHVALMGLEMFGFTPQNLDVLWADPLDYVELLEAAVRALALSGMNVSIYNHQLCTLPRTLWPFARKSISDWKNVYAQECQACGVLEYCGGMFQSGTKRHSRGIRAQPPLHGSARDAMDLLTWRPVADAGGP